MKSFFTETQISELYKMASYGKMYLVLIEFSVDPHRYSEEDIKFLLNLKWWNKDANWLCNNYELLLNIDKLKDIFQK